MEKTSALFNIDLTSQRLTRFIVALFGGSTGTMIIAGFSLGLLVLIESNGALNPFTHLFFLPFITSVYSLIGVLITLKQPRNAIGWLLLLVGFCSALTLLSGAYTEFARFALTDDSGALSDIFIWLNTWVWWIPSMVPLTYVLLLFPDGKVPSPRWRIISAITGIGLTAGTLATAFHPGPLSSFGLPNRNVYGIVGAAAVLEVLLNVASILIAIGLAGSFASVIVRYRSATGDTRIQLKWLLSATSVVFAALALFLVLWLIDSDNAVLIEMGITVTSGGITFIIGTIGIAILQHHLWNIDGIINRTLVYSVLTAIVIGMYILIVTFLSIIFEGDNLLFSLAATGIVAVSFQPIREIVQRAINRLMFGDRDEPYIVLERLSRQLEPVMLVHEILPTVVQTIAQALQLPYVAIALQQDRRYKIAATYPENGRARDHTFLEKLPLRYQSENIGQLWLAPRGQSEVFSASDLKLLEVIARQASIAAYNVRLTTDLQQSREELVTTREEERRRLRRDLHDGLGPVLASMSFRLDAIHNLVDHDVEQAKKLVTELKNQMQLSLAEIRRIAYNLRPPALDELGLIGALREHCVALDGADALQIVFDAPQQLPALSAAVEVAAYRIIIEAVTNVQRHANASLCTVRLNIDTSLRLEVLDNGCGIANDQRSGIGLTAMHERASELGGECVIQNRSNGGTSVYAVLPLVQEA